MHIDLLANRFYDYYLIDRRLSKHTVRCIRGHLNYYLKFSGIEVIEHVTKQSIREFFIFGRVTRNWKPHTTIRAFQSLTVFFRWCLKNGYVIDNPMPEIELPKPDKILPRSITKQDAMKILEVTYNYPYSSHFLRCRNHAIFAMMIYTGLRKSEVLNLMLTDVDTENLTVFVSKGKGAKDRVVPMSYALAESLRRYLKERSKLKKTCSHFFAGLILNKAFTDTGIRKLVIQISKASGIRFTLHKLRHTFATLMLEGGCDIYSLSRMMGHSDIKTTTIYLSASVQHLRSQVSKHPLNDLGRYA
ncbi:MAG: tyrosine-type recombinase/integrase [Bacteroidetes bacterium]|nr:tyrosine-type recombinase/integrase [Bacteroidota bacterium]